MKKGPEAALFCCTARSEAVDEVAHSAPRFRLDH
jgi:hypothetical protein